MAKDQISTDEAEKNGQTEAGEKKTKRGNPLNYAISSDYLSNPRPLEFANGLRSDEFAMEKCAKVILEPLSLETEKEWLNFAKQVWTWAQEAEYRKKEALADELISKAMTDEELLRIVKSRLAALKS